MIIYLPNVKLIENLCYMLWRKMEPKKVYFSEIIYIIIKNYCKVIGKIWTQNSRWSLVLRAKYKENVG